MFKPIDIAIETTPINWNSSQAQGLIGFWPMNEKGGLIVYDKCMGKVDGTLQAGITRTAGRYGNVVSFDTTQGILTSKSITSNGDFSIFAKVIIKGNGSASYNNIFLINASPFKQLYVDNTTNYLTFYSNGTGILSTNSAVPLNIESLIGVTYKGTTLSFYINDKVVFSGTYTVGNVSGVVQVGYFGTNGWSNGHIWDVRLYNRALSQAEVKDIYLNPLGIYRKQPSLVGNLLSLSITISNLLQAQTLTQPSLTQQNILSVAPANNNQILDAISLVQQNLLTINNIANSQTLDNVSILQQTVLILADIFNSQILDLVNLVQQNLLSILNLSETQILQNVDLVQQNIIILAELFQDQTLDPVNLVQQNILTINSENQNQTLENTTLIVQGILTVSAITLLQTLENVLLTQQNIISPDNISSAQNLEAITLSSSGSLNVFPVENAQTLDNLTLIQQNILNITGLFQNEFLENIYLTQQNTLFVNNIFQTQSLQNIDISFALIISPDSLLNEQNLTNISLIQANTLAILALANNQTLEEINLSQNSILIIDNLLHSQLLASVRLNLGGVKLSNDVIYITTASGYIFVTHS